MTLKQARAVAKGRVWTGEDALKLGLVDQLGGLKDAIQVAKQEANLSQVCCWAPKVCLATHESCITPQIDCGKHCASTASVSIWTTGGTASQCVQEGMKYHQC